MKVHEVITKLKEFDGNLDIGGVGHFGEILYIDDIHEYISHSETFIVIDIDEKGDEPE